jgi:hypothetical protein
MSACFQPRLSCRWERRRREIEKRSHYAGVKNMLYNARRELGKDSPVVHLHAGSQPTVPDPRPQGNSDSEASYVPLSLDCSTPSLTKISGAGEQ